MNCQMADPATPVRPQGSLSDARVFIVPDKDHRSVARSEPYRRILQEMSEKFLASDPRKATAPADQPDMTNSGNPNR